MKKLNKLLALCLALTMLLLCVPFTASAAESEYGPEDLRSIHGIDYNRITQKATGDGKSYPVELKMGDLTFNGELTGSHGLSYEELNKIINDVLKEKKLTVEQIQLVKALSKNVEDKAIEHWGLQIMEGLISYIPMDDTIANEIGGWNDIFAYMVHDMDEKNVIEYLADRQRQKLIVDKWKIAENGLKKYEGYLEVVGRAADAIPLAGEMLNTLKVAEEWLKGNERLEKYLKDLEQKMADVNDFYSECSRRANKLAEEKGAGSYVIKFDKEKNYRTYNATFWGVSNLTMGATLSGVLEGSNTEGVAGTYTGTLWLDVESVDMSGVDNAFFTQCEAINQMRSQLVAYSFTDGAYDPTTLRRSVQGEITVTITTNDLQNIIVDGNIMSGEDEVNFHFRHSWSIRLKSQFMAVVGDDAYRILTATSDDILTLTAPTLSGYKTYSRDPGTVWKPLESGIAITIEFGK